MITLRLEEKQIQIGDRTYVLRMNMSVLERIQEACGGEIKGLMHKNMYDGNAITVAAMLNDYAEDQGWEQDWTDRKVKKLFNPAMMKMLDVTGMFFRAMTPETEEGTAKTAADGPKTEETKPDEDSGN
jgi:hypothetical protein